MAEEGMVLALPSCPPPLCPAPPPLGRPHHAPIALETYTAAAAAAHKWWVRQCVCFDGP